MGGSSKMPQAPASPYTGLGQANTQALSGMTNLQNAPNYPMQTYQAVAPGLASVLQGTTYSPQGTVNAGNFMTGQGQGMYGQAQDVYNLGMDPQQMLHDRLFQAQQEQTRAGEAARGILTSPIGQQLESQANTDWENAWQNQRLGRAAQGAAAAQGLYGAGAQNILGGQAMAGAVPGSQLGWAQGLQGLGMGGYALPQQNIQNWSNYLSQGAQAQNQAYQNMMQQYNAKMGQQGQQGQQLGQMAGMAAMALMMMSDIRTKRDITHIGELPDGTPAYIFRYKNAPEFHIGVMAQDILESHPEAVHDIDGVLHVDYEALLGGM